MTRHDAKGKGRITPEAGNSLRPDPKTGLWSRTDTNSGRFADLKQQSGSFKLIPREN